MVEETSENTGSLPKSTFFDLIFRAVKENDKSTLANVKCADRPALMYRFYPLLAKAGINLDEKSSLPYAVLSASIVRLGLTANGTLPLGQAIRYCYKDREPDDPALQARLRRLLSCETTVELSKVLAKMLPMIESGLEGKSLDYQSACKFMLYFEQNPRRSRMRLIKDFYLQDTQEEVQP